MSAEEQAIDQIDPKEDDGIETEPKVESSENEVPAQDEPAAPIENRIAEIKKQQKKQLEEIRKKQNEALESEKSASMQDRFNFLLQQTDIFRHFIEGSGAKNPTAKSGRRSKKSEEAEDKVLVEQALDTVQSVRFTESPPYIKNGEMRYYQLQGLNWLIQLHDHGINGILADEMGLGKTLQTISLLGYLKNICHIGGPHLVIVPKSTLANWGKEFKHWCPSLDVFLFHGNKAERAAQRENILNEPFDVVITTYEMAIIEKSTLKKYSWRYLIIDEAHRIKNENSILSRVVRMYNSNHRLLITGTPLQNNLHELWALLNFLLPEVFSSSDNFDEWFDIDDTNKNEVMEKLHKILKPFLLRRLKSEVEKSLPPKKETKLYIGLSDMQRQWYTNILSKNIDVINGPGKETRVRLLNILMQLRKCCNHPYLFQGAEPGPPYTTGEHLINNSGKMILLDRLLVRLKELGSRVLIFSQMSRVLDILEDYMFYRKFEYCRIDGSTSGEDREDAIERYNAPGSSVFTFLLSTRAGGLGINLATADTVILFDSDWNPQVDLQAQDRAHRIGQTKPVNVYRLVTQNTVEEKVIERAEAKLYLDALVIQQGRLAETNKALSKRELMGMIKFGADEVFQCKSSAVTDADIDIILKQGEVKTEEINQKLKKNANNLLSFSLADSNSDVNMYQFMGVDYQKKVGPKVKKPEKWIDLPQREGKKKTYTEDEYYGGVFGRKYTRKRKKDVIKAPKQPTLYDFQFYPAKLKPLLDKELAKWKSECEKKEKWLVAQQKRREEKEKAIEEAKKRGEEPLEEDEPEPEPPAPARFLSVKQEKEKDKLISQGFPNWTKKDFTAFTKACEYHGREAYEEIARDIGTKTKQEVIQYSKVFWKKLKDLADGKKILANIERGERRIVRVESMIEALETKVASYKDPRNELKLVYTYSKKPPPYLPEEDRFLLYMTSKVGYGNWDGLKQSVVEDVTLRYNWFLKSRTADDLAKRVDSLIHLIEKENATKKRAEPTGKRNGSTRTTKKEPAAKKRRVAS